jgi:signal peptidase I
MEDYRDDFPELPATPAFPEWAAQLPSVIQGRDVVVPPDHYFAMGDNRDFSSDSRYWGFVPRENIVGKPLVIYWSFETSSEDYRKTSPSDYFDKLTDVIFNFPQKTRWRRMFRLIH